MNLIHYLERHFFTREQLLERCGFNAAQLEHLQQQRMAPRPSYRLRLDIGCDSFLGQHAEQAAVDYYAKGSASWFTHAATLDCEDAARQHFTQRYRQRLGELAASGIAPVDPDFSSDERLRAEWEGFLDGAYGVCTVSGLPEDIAAKEAAIAVIREMTGEREPCEAELARLRQAVDLLDSVAAPFAPHEVERSSRRRYVDAMRAAYGL